MIKITSVTKKYPGKNKQPVVALEGLELKVSAGNFLMVTGPSGSGKSTLLFILGGMLRPTEGEVLVTETNVYNISPVERARFRLLHIGFVFQTFNLIPYLNCAENVALPAILLGKKGHGPSLVRAKKMLDRLGLGKRLEHRPSELSVGERQRVAICRSLINAPDVLLADEPTGNLDHSMTDDVMDLLLELNSDGQTIVMATHEQRLAEMGTHMISLSNGKIHQHHLSSEAGA